VSYRDIGKIFWRLVILGTILLAFIFVISQVFLIAQVKYDRYITAFLIAIVLFIIFRIFIKAFANVLERNLEKKNAKPLLFLISVLSYFVIILAVLASLGIDLSSVILGSAFGSVIIGLAAQQVLSNLFAGILIIWNKPFVLGDYVEINTWQYSFLMPTISPKFFSRDEFLASIKGVVDEITIFYTVIKRNDETIVKLPNSIVIQALIVTHTENRLDNIRFEVPKGKDFNKLKESLGNFVEKEGLAKLKDIVIEEVTLSTYLVNIKYQPLNGNPSEIRTRIILEIINLTSN